MKIKLQYKGKYLTLGYVSKTGNTIVVWYTPQAIVGELVDEVMQNLDLHATYPIDGNFHYSYKFLNPKENLNYDKKIYHDRIVVVRKSLKNEFIDKIKYDRVGTDFLGHMVPNKLPEALDDPNYNMFLFPQGAISMIEKNIALISEESLPNASDIVLNVDNCEGAILNFGFSIYNKSRVEFYQHGEVKRNLYFENVYVEGFVRVVSEANKN